MLDALFRWVSDQGQRVFTALDSKVPAVPVEVASSCATISDAMTQVAFLKYFFPFEAIAIGIGIVLAGVVAGIVIKVVRIVASFGTLGGGAV